MMSGYMGCGVLMLWETLCPPNPPQSCRNDNVRDHTQHRGLLCATTA